MSKTFDLSTLNLPAGTHSVTVKARASGCTDSVASNAASYVVPTEGLAYELSSAGTSYTCTGIGTATDTDIVIASEIDGIPVTTIGENAFNGCSKLTSVVIPDSVYTIDTQAFYDCTGLTSVTIPKSSCTFWTSAFGGCSSLTAVHITDMTAWCHLNFIDISSNPLYYADNLYLNRELVTELVIPETVTSIGNYAFCGCDSLTKVTLGDNVSDIGEKAFAYCPNMKTVTIGSGVNRIRTRAFLTFKGGSVRIPKNVQHIGYKILGDAGGDNGISIYCEVRRRPHDWDDNWADKYDRSDLNDKHRVYWGSEVLELGLTIDGVEYKFESGMTWKEWVNSTYNTLGLVECEGGYIGKTIDGTEKYVRDGGGQVTSDKKIRDVVYYLETSSHGGGSN